jgi:hypothetical protein
MMKKNLSIVACLLVGAMLSQGCDTQTRREGADQDTTAGFRTTPPSEMNTRVQVDTVNQQNTSVEPMAQGGTIRISEMTGSPEYMDAMLQMSLPQNQGNNTNLQINYDVRNFQLGGQTPDAQNKGIANSGEGEHIHLIVNNQPYVALYEPRHTARLEQGNNVILSFLSRSYHESVKNPEAYVLRQVMVGSGGNRQEIDLTAPHMFYSRPKGEYAGPNETQRVMLDFYLVNANLDRRGFRVKATINGEDFMIYRWAPFIIEGMPMGENTIRLELQDNEGRTVQSPYNPVERKVTLKGTPAS